jgi:hypothetical protein
MTIRVWPVDAVNGAPVYAGRGLRQMGVSVFLAGATPVRPLGALSGVRPGTSQSTVSVTSQTVWACATVAGVMDVEAANEAGAYSFASDQVVTGAISAANASNPRVDLIYAQLSDPAESDGSVTPSVQILYLAGNPAANPQAPATPARSLALAVLNVPKSGGGVPTASWVAPTLAAAGGSPTFPTLAQLNAWTPAPNQRAKVTADSTANNGEYIYSAVAPIGWFPTKTIVNVNAGASAISLPANGSTGIIPGTAVAAQPWARRVRVNVTALVSSLASGQVDIILRKDGAIVREYRVSASNSSACVPFTEDLPANTQTTYQVIGTTGGGAGSVTNNPFFTLMTIETEAL